MSQPIQTAKTYVFGHQKPDTDSICAALAYTAYKKAVGDENIVACRLGPVNKETQFVLDTFDVEAPQLIKSVKPQVSDINFNNSAMVTEDASVYKTMALIIDNPGRSLPVVDADQKLIGIVSLPDIMHAYTDSFTEDFLKRAETPYQNIIDLLEARVVGDNGAAVITGNLYDNSQLAKDAMLRPEDIILTTANDGALRQAFTFGSRTIIVSDTPAGTTPPIPRNYDGLVILTHKRPFQVIRLLSQGIPIKRYINRDAVEFFMLSETLEDVKSNMVSSSHSRFPVVDENGRVIATITKSSLIDFGRKRVILVDHNERTQSIAGLDDAEIAEVIDHHRIAEIATAAPLYMRVEPVGCTCTIITKMFNEKELLIPKAIAGLLLSAIISDTLLFNSPTCTDQDRAAVQQLGAIAGVNVKEYGRKMLIAGSNLSDMSVQQIIGADRKIFTMGDYKVAVSQINTGDYKALFEHLQALLDQMRANCEAENTDLAILMVTDIVLGGSELLVAGKHRELAHEAFGIEDEDISQFFPGMFSRKKQVVPPLMNAAALL